MKTLSKILTFSFLSLLVTSSQQSFAREIVDSTGTRVIVADNPQRIITLTPALGELAADILEDELTRLLAVSEATDYPPALKKKLPIGPYSHINLEKILSFKPDLVIATTDGNSKDQVLHLRELNVPVVVVSSSSFKEVEDSIRLLGTALGKEQRGRQLASQLAKGIDRFKKRAQQRKKTTVLMQLGDEPVVVVGKKSFLNEAIELVGATNVYNDTDSHYPRPAVENIVQRDPDVILIVAMHSNAQIFKEMARNWLAFKNLKAVRSKKVLILPGDTIVRPTIRLLEGLSILERSIYD